MNARTLDLYVAPFLVKTAAADPNKEMLVLVSFRPNLTSAALHLLLNSERRDSLTTSELIYSKENIVESINKESEKMIGRCSSDDENILHSQIYSNYSSMWYCIHRSIPIIHLYVIDWTDDLKLHYDLEWHFTIFYVATLQLWRMLTQKKFVPHKDNTSKWCATFLKEVCYIGATHCHTL